MWAPVAHATSLDASLADVRAQIESGDYKGAIKALKLIEKGLDDLDARVEQATLARVWLYRGVAEHLRGPKKDRDVNAWRQALVVDNTIPWDESLLNDDDLLGLFEALRSEVRGRGSVTPGIPEATGLAKLYVNGVRMREDESLLQGTHLAQIECPDAQGTYSMVTDFEDPLDWFAMCPDGVDTSVVVEEDEWSEFGPTFGSGTGTPDPEPDPDPGSDPGSDSASDSASDSTSDSTSEPGSGSGTSSDVVDASGGGASGGSTSSGGFAERSVASRVLLAGGGTLLVSGTVLNFALVNPAYAEIEAARADPYNTTREDADQLTSRFNVARYATMAVLGAGVAASASGVFLSGPVQPLLGWGSVGLSVEF